MESIKLNVNNFIIDKLSNYQIRKINEKSIVLLTVDNIN
jgi:hypothetical protein